MTDVNEREKKNLVPRQVRDLLCDADTSALSSICSASYCSTSCLKTPHIQVNKRLNRVDELCVQGRSLQLQSTVHLDPVEQ